MNEVPRRRWILQFSLRTLFVVMTVVCLWLGWHIKLVRDRTKTLQVVRELGGSATEARDPYSYAEFKSPPARPVPFLRRLLGDKYVGHITTPLTTDEKLLQEIRDRFPEAEIEISRPQRSSR